jgi:hypothetical protein
VGVDQLLLRLPIGQTKAGSMLRIRALRATSDITRSSIRSSSGHDFGVKELLLLRTDGDADYSPETLCLRKTGLILLNLGIVQRKNSAFALRL